MVKKANTVQGVVMPNFKDGEGHVVLTKFIEGDELLNSANIFGLITIPPKSTIGYHQHVGNGEAFYFLSGSGIYHDNGEDVRVGKGDVAFLPPEGFHGVTNDGDEDINLIAVVLKDNLGK